MMYNIKYEDIKKCQKKMTIMAGTGAYLSPIRHALVSSTLPVLAFYIWWIMSEGWIKIHRKLSENPLWKCEPFTRGQAWVDLILLANHKDNFFYKRGIKVNLKRGQVGWSELALSDRWKWSRTKVRKFLKDLKKEQQIDFEKNKITTMITVINYDEYQKKEQQVIQQKDNKKTSKEHQKDIDKNDNNVKNEKNNKYYKEISIKVLEYFNKTTGKKCKSIKGNLSKITARLKEDYTFQDCIKVIDNKNIDPYFIENPQFMRIETLFRPSNFDSYLNEIPKKIVEEPEPLTEREEYEERKERIERLKTEGKGDSEEYQRCVRLNKDYEEMYLRQKK